MTKHEIKLLLDACFMAKRIVEAMLKLPDGIKPRHIHVIDCIHILNNYSPQVRVSDVSDMLAITTPSVTKLINELEEKGVVEKSSKENDKRITLLNLTELGKNYYNKYVERYHSDWSNNLTEVTDDEVAITINVIKKLSSSMPKGE